MRIDTRPISVWMTLVLALSLIACGTFETGSATPVPPIATPTVNQLFARAGSLDETREAEDAADEATAATDETAADSADTTATEEAIAVVVEPTEAPAATATPVPPFSIFDETINSDWELTQSTMQFESAFAEEAYKGNYSLAMRPATSFQTLFFTVRQDATASYTRSNVQSISFRFYSGNGSVGPEDFTLTLVGSNTQGWYDATDQSAVAEDATVFEDISFETLGVTEPIPPSTWVTITADVAQQSSGADYEYVTGFFLKNNEGFLLTVLLDEVNLELSNPTGLTASE